MLIMPAVHAEEEVPSMEFLEYLGEWETQEGEWIDPINLADDEVATSVDIELVYTKEEEQDE